MATSTRPTEMVHPEVEFVRPGGQSAVRGVDALRGWMEPDAFESQTIEPLDFRIRANKALVRQHGRARGAGSGIEMEVDGWAVWTFTGRGLATRIEIYLDHQEAEALEAAGPRE